MDSAGNYLYRQLIGASSGSVETGDLRSLVSEASFWLPEYSLPSAWTEHAPFAFWLAETLRPHVFVELGAHFGFSYFTFCQARTRLGLDTEMFAIDTWEGDDFTKLTYGENIFELITRLNERYVNFSTLVRSTFADALSRFPDHSIDLLHIDGSHHYNDVVNDLTSWWSKLTPDAIVLMHDTNIRTVSQYQVWRVMDLAKTYMPTFQFYHSFGLGVLSPGSVAPATLNLLFNASENLAARVRYIYSCLGLSMERRSRRGDGEDKVASMLAAAQDYLEGA